MTDPHPAALPLLTADVLEQLFAAKRGGKAIQECSLDLQRTLTQVRTQSDAWFWNGRRFPYPAKCRQHTIYHWFNDQFQSVARYSSSLVKLVPTDWGPPTFEIDGIKMLPSAQVSPYTDAATKVGFIRPRGKRVLDTCGGLGYFAAWCIEAGATSIESYEKNADVLWLRSLNPWSPAPDPRLTVTQADVTEAIVRVPDNAVDAVLHDPPRFGIAGELYSRQFYEQLARVLKHRGIMFHYTGAPNHASSGRDLALEVSNRLRAAGFSVKKTADGVLAIKTEKRAC